MNLLIIEENQFQTIISKLDYLHQLMTENHTTKDSEDVLLTTTETAKRLKVCTKTVINYIESGKLKAIKYSKGEGRRGHFKLLESDVKKFIKNNRLGY